MTGRCNRCHRSMAGTTAYDGACPCGGLIEAVPAKAAAASASAKIRQQSGVSKPLGSGCWAEVRVYTGSRFPAFINCAKSPRPGHLTCHWHADREDAAQAAQHTP